MGYIQQVIEGRYIEREKLMTLLRTTFGEGHFVVRVSSRLSVPITKTDQMVVTTEQVDPVSTEILD